MRHHSMLLWSALLIAGVTFLGSSVVCAQEPALANVPTAEQIAGWIKELDADSYAVRERASKNLREAGPVAVDRLAVAVADPSIEVSTRAGAVLQRIADGSDEATLNQIAAALQKLNSKRSAVRTMVADILVQQKKYKHNRAVAQVRALGGGLSGNWEGQPAHAEAMIMAPLAIEDVAVAPAFAIEDAPVPDLPAIAIEEPLPPKRGIFGLLARLIEPSIAPAPPIEFVPDLIPPPVAVPEAPDAVPLAPIAEAVPPPAEALPRFDAIPALPEPLEVPAEAPVAPAIEVPEELLPADAIPVDDVPLMIDFAPVPVPIMIGGEELGESEAYAELVLDRNFRGGDKDLAVLKDIPEIYSLSISGAKLTDEALPHIAALPKLTTLNVRETAFSSAALRKLRQQRPELSVICRSSAMLGINAGLEGPCVLTSVFFKSGAHDAGLRDGDEIVEVDGQKVRDFSDLTIAVYPHKAGEKLSVKFRRNNDEQSAEVLLKPRDGVEE